MTYKTNIKDLRKEKNHTDLGDLESIHGEVSTWYWFGERNGHENQEEANQWKHCEQRQKQRNHVSLVASDWVVHLA